MRLSCCEPVCGEGSESHGAQRTAARKAAPRAAAAARPGKALVAMPLEGAADGDEEGAETEADPVVDGGAVEDAGLLDETEVGSEVRGEVVILVTLVLTLVDLTTEVEVETLEEVDGWETDDPLLVAQAAGSPVPMTNAAEFWLRPLLSLISNSREEPAGEVTNQVIELFVSPPKLMTVLKSEVSTTEAI